MIEFPTDEGAQGIGRSNGSVQNWFSDRRITRVQASGNNVPRATTSALFADLNPPTGTTQFETLESAWPSQARRPRRESEAARNYAKLSGPIKLLRKIASEWGLDSKETAVLLGFEDASVVEALYHGQIRLRQRDAKDRLRAVISIAADLNSLYRDPAASREWLQEPQVMLNDLRPSELLLEGSMENLLRVKQYAEYLAGR